MPPAYLDKLKAERAERLARMKIPRDSAAAARVPFSAQDPEWIHSLWWEEIATIKLRLKALEQRLEVLAECARPAAPRAQIRIGEIQNALCRRYRVTMGDLQGPSRREPINRVRQIAMHLARELTGKSFITIACQFGGRRHAGVFKAWRNIERLRKGDPELEAELQQIGAQLREGVAASAVARSTTEIKRGAPDVNRAGVRPPDADEALDSASE
jgi:hypothetical protein